jgi:hypothetical protein
MLQMASLSLILLTAVATHLFMSFAQTLMHYKLGHHPIGGKFFHNQINFHHAYYSKDHLLSRTYLGDKGNNTPFVFIPVFLVGACTYFVLPVDLFVAQVVARVSCRSSSARPCFWSARRASPMRRRLRSVRPR